MRKNLFSLIVLVTFALFSSTKTIDDISKILQKNAGRVQDMQADVVMEMDLGKAGTKTQRMKIWVKGKDKIKMEMEKQTMIMNGDKMMMDTPQGKRVINQPTTKGMPPGINLQQGIGDFFKENSGKIVSQGRNKAVIKLIPKDKNPMMSKIEMTVDTKRGVITEQRMYSNYGTTKMRMEYKNIGGIWVISSIDMIVPTPQGKVGRMKIRYKNIKINKGISDKMFKISNKTTK